MSAPISLTKASLERVRANPRSLVLEDEIARALTLAAYIVTRHGPVYAPIFEFLEQELARVRAMEDPVERAQRHLASATVPVPSHHRGRDGVKTELPRPCPA